mmetsp:Transcript_23289/g.35268  ORF Transcript_23289/g.35268 Transcript_23289/m.35268 type:complete len:241 (-) Transcript_23289:221-943(-)
MPLFLIILMLITHSSSAWRVAILTGSTRTAGPPNPILGPRVAQYIQKAVEDRPDCDLVVTIPPLGKLLEKPHFAYAPGQVPQELKDLHDQLIQADAYVTITPEFNHGPSPGLLNTLNHFGSSVFGFKPSAIVTYSPSQWGGVRAGYALRPILSELGCLPVSAMVHLPKAHEILDEDGSVAPGEDSEQWNKYVDRTLSQLEWWAKAAMNHRKIEDPYAKSPAFQRTPSERNAPKTPKTPKA